MVVSLIQQPNNTYQTWIRFRFPDSDNGPVAAFAVPTDTYRYIQNGYALISTMMVINLWAIAVACGLYLHLKNPKTANRVNDISMMLWSKREAAREPAVEALLYVGKGWEKWWYYPLVLVLIGVWVASLAAGILLPSRLFLGNVAPVNPSSIFAPSLNLSKTDSQTTYNVFELDVQRYLRAAGAAFVANDALRGKVQVGMPVFEGTWDNKAENLTGDTIQRIDYSYKVTGGDLGLQNIPQLVLNVAGSCRTDYTWQVGFKPIRIGLQDVYQAPWDNATNYTAQYSESLGSSATFLLRDPATNDPTSRGNFSWGIINSSVGRRSFFASVDPWYRTGEMHGQPSADGFAYTVLPGRPALSCWEGDVWSFKGQSTDITNLQSILPPDSLSNATANILARYLGLPLAVTLGNYLGSSALQSSQGTIDSLFDAGSSSIHRDLSQIILGAYIVTVNTLTDTTLYFQYQPPPAENITNMARDGDDSNGTLPGVADFVVFSDQVASLSLALIILIPFLTLASWILMHTLLVYSPLKLTRAMEPTRLLQAVRGQFGEPTLYIDDDGKQSWKL